MQDQRVVSIYRGNVDTLNVCIRGDGGTGTRKELSAGRHQKQARF